MSEFNNSQGACTSAAKFQIKVFCRVKPFNGPYSAFKIVHPEVLDENGNEREFLQIEPKHIIYPMKTHIINSFKNPNSKPEIYCFGFAKVFDPRCTQECIFNLAASPIIESVLDGFNGTIFAYGQTGTGKTFTMSGDLMDAELRGIIPRTISYIFRKLENWDTHGNKITSLSVSYLEIYNEVMYDLLQSSNSVTFVNNEPKNLSKHHLYSESEASELLKLGNTNRAISETSLNQASTRSHCMFTIYVSGIRESSGTAVPFCSKLHLVDLAGSERMAKTTTNEKTLNESKCINLSLSYLEQVITALNSGQTHIPYRNSMLTNVLKDSLGGNSLTTFLSMISMEQNCVQETITTCRFMQRVGKVKNYAARNIQLVQFEPETETFDAETTNAPIRELKTPVELIESKDEVCALRPSMPEPEPEIDKENRKKLVIQIVNNFVETSDAESVIKSSCNSSDIRVLKEALNMIRTELIEYKTETYRLQNVVKKQNALLRQYQKCCHCSRCDHPGMDLNNNDSVCMHENSRRRDLFLIKEDSFLPKKDPFLPLLRPQPVPAQIHNQSSIFRGIFSPPPSLREILFEYGPRIFLTIYDEIVDFLFPGETDPEPEPRPISAQLNENDEDDYIIH